MRMESDPKEGSGDFKEGHADQETGMNAQKRRRSDHRPFAGYALMSVGLTFKGRDRLQYVRIPSSSCCLASANPYFAR